LYTQLTDYELDKLYIPGNEDAEVTLETLENIILTSVSKSIEITQYKGKNPQSPGGTKLMAYLLETKKKPITSSKIPKIYST